MLVSVKTTIPWQSWLMVSFFCLQLLTFSLADRDFYEILNVPRSASTKEIRKAFKKLAVSEHPDKKTDDPKAHEKFLKITRAYEVLKDDQLRKKYDLHGEEGLRKISKEVSTMKAGHSIKKNLAFMMTIQKS